MLKVDHVSYTVSNLERSIDFYQRCFGFALTWRSQSVGARIEAITGYAAAQIEVAMLELDGSSLELIEYVRPKGEHRARMETKDVGQAHLAFRSDDIQRDYERLAGLGVRFKSPPQSNPVSGNSSVYGVDIDGIPLELIQRPQD